MSIISFTLQPFFSISLTLTLSLYFHDVERLLLLFSLCKMDGGTKADSLTFIMIILLCSLTLPHLNILFLPERLNENIFPHCFSPTLTLTNISKKKLVYIKKEGICLFLFEKFPVNEIEPWMRECEM
jgi:hypothetical protein